jgi:hypothetical protein
MDFPTDCSGEPAPGWTAAPLVAVIISVLGVSLVRQRIQWPPRDPTGYLCRCIGARFPTDSSLPDAPPYSMPLGAAT